MTDTHAHYDDPAFDPDRDNVTDRALSVCRYIINAGISVPRSQSSLTLAQKYDRIYAAVGIHPQYDGDISAIEGLLSEDKVVAVGEIGLDYRNADAAEKDRQRELFTAQLELSKKYTLPVIIHCVDAWGDMLGILKSIPVHGVLHGFTGSAETARELVDMGLYIGFGGRATYPGAKRAVRALADVPDDRILFETDAPYAAPYNYRGQRCEGYMLADTVAFAAKVRGVTPERLSALSDENASALFGTNV